MHDLALSSTSTTSQPVAVSVFGALCCWLSASGLPGTGANCPLDPSSTRKPCRVIEGNRSVELTLASSGGDLLDLWALAADGMGDCDGSLDGGAASDLGVGMNEGVTWPTDAGVGGGSLCIDGLVLLSSRSKALLDKERESV